MPKDTLIRNENGDVVYDQQKARAQNRGVVSSGIKSYNNENSIGVFSGTIVSAELYATNSDSYFIVPSSSININVPAGVSGLFIIASVRGGVFIAGPFLEWNILVNSVHPNNSPNMESSTDPHTTTDHVFIPNPSPGSINIALDFRSTVNTQEVDIFEYRLSYFLIK